MNLGGMRVWIDSAGTLIIRWNDDWVTHLRGAGHLLLMACFGVSCLIAALVLKGMRKPK